MNERRSLPLPFLDLLFILLLALLILTQIKQPVKTSEIEQKAEFIVELVWDDKAASDIDLWFRAPTGEVIYFGSKQAGPYSLDRDDLGKRNDTITDPDGETRVIFVNREILTLRGWTPGPYTVNVHVYNWSDQAPITATVRVIRLNPFRIEIERQVTLEARGQEQTIATFTLDRAGKVGNVDYGFVPLTRAPRQ